MMVFNEGEKNRTVASTKMTQTGILPHIYLLDVVCRINLVIKELVPYHSKS